MKRQILIIVVSGTLALASDIKDTAEFRRIHAVIQATPAIDTHTHLMPHQLLPLDRTPSGLGFSLRTLWSRSYMSRIRQLPPWPADGSFDAWWAGSKAAFDDVRAASLYRYLLPAIQDLYGIDFDAVTDADARELNNRLLANYSDSNRDAWRRHVVERANIELMLIDPYWNRLKFEMEYPFQVPVLNVTMLIVGSHPSRTPQANDSPYVFAEQQGLPIGSIDQYLGVLDRLFQKAREAGVVNLKTTSAYQRDLRFHRVSKERAAAAFGKAPAHTSDQQQRDFEDFIFWELCRLSAKYDLPFQIHTGDARVQGSNPMLLVEAIEANPNTKFILFHGGYPWVGETGAIAMKHRNVWIDSNWLPTLSYTMARRAYQEWLDAMPSDRIMWGSDSPMAETIYGSTKTLRRCLAEALAEKVHRGELRIEHAERIGRQIMRENALKVFPRLTSRLRKTN